METLGDRIKALRKRSQETQEQLASVAGVTKQAISKIERVGVIESASSTLDPIARHYGVSLRWLLEGGQEMPPEAASPSVSRSMRLDPEIVRDVADALYKRYERVGGFDLAKQAEEFVRAYELWLGMPDAYEDPEVRKLVIRHADLSQGADHDGQRSEKAPPHGASRARVRTGRRHEA